MVKRYSYTAFIEDNTLGGAIAIEYEIMKQARDLKLKHICHISSLHLGIDHIHFDMPKYEMDYRTYLRTQRDYRQINKILLQVATGLNELHGIGYVHRDLKPENIVLNLRPLEACLIDFNRSLPRTVMTKGHVLGTEGYFPEDQYLRDGSTKWDIYAFAAIIVETDMETDSYIAVKQER